MTVIVRCATVIAQELHRVALDDVLGMSRHELAHAVPKRRDGLDILVQTEDEAVLLAVIAHVLEGVVVDVAVKLDAGLDAPVPFELVHQLVAEEEARLEAAHVSVADRVPVNDLLFRHIFPHLARLFLIDEVGKRPMLGWDLAVVRLARDQGGGDLLERLVEGLVVEEDPIVVELPIEPILNLPDRSSNLPHVRIARQGDECRIHPLASIRGRRQPFRPVGGGLGPFSGCRCFHTGRRATVVALPFRFLFVDNLRCAR